MVMFQGPFLKNKGGGMHTPTPGGMYHNVCPL